MHEILQIGVPITVGVFTAWGALWYRMGKITQEVRDHNRMLAEIQQALEKVLTAGGNKDD